MPGLGRQLSRRGGKDAFADGRRIDAQLAVGRFGAGRVLGGLCYIATTLGADGVIRHTSPGDEIRFGDRAGRPSPPAERLAALFAGTPVQAAVADDIVQALWEKWFMIAAGAALTCLLRGTVGEIMATDGGEAVAEATMAECRAIAAALGRAPRPEAEGRTRRQLTDRQSRWAASMMRDIEAGAPRLEAEHVIGDLIRRGQEAGVAAGDGDARAAHRARPGGGGPQPAHAESQPAAAHRGDLGGGRGRVRHHG